MADDPFYTSYNPQMSHEQYNNVGGASQSQPNVYFHGPVQGDEMRHGAEENQIPMTDHSTMDEQPRPWQKPKPNQSGISHQHFAYLVQDRSDPFYGMMRTRNGSHFHVGQFFEKYHPGILNDNPPSGGVSWYTPEGYYGPGTSMSVNSQQAQHQGGTAGAPYGAGGAQPQPSDNTAPGLTPGYQHTHHRATNVHGYTHGYHREQYGANNTPGYPPGYHCEQHEANASFGFMCGGHHAQHGTISAATGFASGGHRGRHTHEQQHMGTCSGFEKNEVPLSVQYFQKKIARARERAVEDGRHPDDISIDFPDGCEANPIVIHEDDDDDMPMDASAFAASKAARKASATRPSLASQMNLRSSGESSSTNLPKPKSFADDKQSRFDDDRESLHGDDDGPIHYGGVKGKRSVPDTSYASRHGGRSSGSEHTIRQSGKGWHKQSTGPYNTMKATHGRKHVHASEIFPEDRPSAAQMDRHMRRKSERQFVDPAVILPSRPMSPMKFDESGMPQGWANENERSETRTKKVHKKRQASLSANVHETQKRRTGASPAEDFRTVAVGESANTRPGTPDGKPRTHRALGDFNFTSAGESVVHGSVEPANQEEFSQDERIRYLFVDRASNSPEPYNSTIANASSDSIEGKGKEKRKSVSPFPSHY